MIVLVSLLCCIGLIALYSASLPVALPLFKKAVGRQFIWMILGLSFASVAFFIQKKLIHDAAYILYGLGLLSLILLSLIGSSKTGTHRWISIGAIHFQPSEFMKIFVVLCMARYLSNIKLSISEFKSLIIPVSLCIIPMAIVLKQPDLGTSMIFFGIIFPMLFWAGARLFHIFIILSPIVSILAAFNFYTFFAWVVILILILFFSREKIWVSVFLSIFNISLGLITPRLWDRLKPYQQNRILTLFHLEVDPQGIGYQAIQSQTAIGSGGLFGKGLGMGTQTSLKFLPEQHSDFIFSVIGEECGFIGVMIVLVIFFLLMITLLNYSYRVRDRFSSLVIIGTFSILVLHVIINVAMTIGLMPITGLPLPFLSYGGSFIMTCFIFTGLVLNLYSEKL